MWLWNLNRLFLKAFNDDAVTQWSSRQFHSVTTLSDKKYSLKSSLLCFLLSFKECPRVTTIVKFEQGIKRNGRWSMNHFVEFSQDTTHLSIYQQFQNHSSEPSLNSFSKTLSLTQLNASSNTTLSQLTAMTIAICMWQKANRRGWVNEETSKLHQS